MCKLMEEYTRELEKMAEARGREKGFQIGREEGFQIGREEGRKEISKKIAINLWDSGIRDLEKISSLTKLPLDEVKKLIEGNPL